MRGKDHGTQIARSDEWMAGSIARTGHGLGDDEDVTVGGEVFPAAKRLADVVAVDRCLLRVTRRIDSLTYRNPAMVNLNLAGVELAAFYAVVAGAASVSSLAAMVSLYVMAVILLIGTRPLFRRAGRTEELETLLAVRERYQRRRLDLMTEGDDRD